MFQPRSRRKPLGFTLIEVLTVTGIISGLQGQGNYRYAINQANQIKGLNNLRQIYTLLQVQAITGGGLPRADFYPKGDPLKDPKSIVRLIPDAPPQLFVSPFAPPALQDKGLTYAWNDKVNGKDIDSVGNTWLLVDLAAFIADPKIAKPSKYLILYANGRAEAVATLPPDIVKAVEEAQAKGANNR